MFIVLTFALISLQCKTSHVQTLNPEKKVLIISNTSIESMAEPNFTIQSVEFKDNYLNIVVQTIGHKGDNEFELIWSGSIMKSMPPKANFFITHKEINVSGKKPVIHNLSFDLKPMFEKLGKYSEVIVNVKGFPKSISIVNKK